MAETKKKKTKGKEKKSPFSPENYTTPKTTSETIPSSVIPDLSLNSNSDNYDPKHHDEYCLKNPRSKYCKSDEIDEYNGLGIFNGDSELEETLEAYTNPATINSSVVDIYKKTDDDDQLKPPTYKKTKCKCKDGSIVEGLINLKTGKKDCSPCKKSKKAPNPYNREQPKQRKIDNRPLRQQVGVSNFGDVQLKGVITSKNDNAQTISRRTLNNVIALDNNAPKGKRVSQKNNSDNNLPISAYDDVSYNIYGI